jgi:hypothetical protein
LLKQLDHEVLIFKVVPRIETVLVRACEIWDAKVPSELLQEPDKHEVSIYLALNLTRQLLKESIILWL